MTTYLYLNGEILPAEKAAISPMDIGLLRGYAVFDLLRTVKGRPFLLGEHLARFRNSAAHLGLTVPETDSRIAEVINELLRMNGHEEATVRMLLTGGVSTDGMSFDPSIPTFFVLTQDLHEPPASLYESGGKLITHEHNRELPLAKTTNYLTMLRHKSETAEKGALDLLYHDDGILSEAASASFYIVRNGTILAPAEGVLSGTIGNFVIELDKGRHPLQHAEISLEDAWNADEAFLTSTTRGVVPIVRLDDRPVGTGSVGPVTTELMELYRAALEAL